MILLMKLVLGLAFLGILVVFHELGHFLVARAFGIRVERFSVGFGKSLLQWQRGDTTWSFAAVPLGGYVRMAGEHPDEESCTGCRLCVYGCPYGAMFYNEVQNVAGKCDLCAGRAGHGLEPACVQHCIGGALQFVSRDEATTLSTQAHTVSIGSVSYTSSKWKLESL